MGSAVWKEVTVVAGEGAAAWAGRGRGAGACVVVVAPGGEVGEAMALAAGLYGRVDAVVHVAAAPRAAGVLEDLVEERLREVTAVLTGALPQLLGQRSGRLEFRAAVAGEPGAVDFALYAAAKQTLGALTGALRLEEAMGIRTEVRRPERAGWDAARE